MSGGLVDVIRFFNTGTYVVTRPAPGLYVDGDWVVSGGPTTLLVDASVQDSAGQDLQDNPEAKTTNDVRTLWTEVELRAPVPGSLAPGTTEDMISIDGLLFRVTNVTRARLLDRFYKVTVAKVNVP